MASFRVKYATLDELVVGYSTDLSRGGMFLQTDQFLPLNAVVRVHLELPGGSAIPIICRVVFLRDREAASRVGGPTGMGVEFLDLGPEGLALLERFIQEMGAGATPEPPPPPPNGPLTLIVVDDEEVHRARTAEVFRRRGDVVYTGNDGFEGLALCLKESPDVILADVQMPRMDGWQLLRMIRARPSMASVPVVFLTTLGGEEERLKGYRLGVDDYIPKPWQEDDMRMRVDRLVSRVQRMRRPNVERKTLRGDLEQVSLASVLSFLEAERKTGELLLLGTGKARLLMKEGRLFRVEYPDAGPDVPPSERIYELLGWSRGQFEFAAQELDSDGPTLSISALVLEHARRADERNR
jgi:uncharacterized protein (TIGR02266 family)